jgi:hypothetical protein
MAFKIDVTCINGHDLSISLDGMPNVTGLSRP